MPKFNQQGFLIYRFQVTRTKSTVNLHRATYNRFCQLIIHMPIQYYISDHITMQIMSIM